MSVGGLVKWAQAYYRAAELLHFAEPDDRHTPFYGGPIVQSVGLATELTLKAMLRGNGKTTEEVRGYGHKTYDAYFAARECFDESKFIELHMSNTQHLKVPAEIIDQLISKGEPHSEVEIRWRVYFHHLRLLDTVYDRPFKSRYVQPGAVKLPETEIVLFGTKILLAAMEERLELA